jgi:hypothetical protein
MLAVSGSGKEKNIVVHVVIIKLQTFFRRVQCVRVAFVSR